MKPGTSKTAILSHFYALIVKNRHTYCWPALATIQKNIQEKQRIEISVRTVKKHLMELRDNGYIKSFRRYGREKDGTIRNLPSNRQLSLKGLRFLRSIGVRIAKWLWKWIFERVLPDRNDARSRRQPIRNRVAGQLNEPKPIGVVIEKLMNFST